MTESTEKIVLTADECAAVLGISRSTWYQMFQGGKTPIGVKLNRCRRWSSEELKKWVAAGCPPRRKWIAAQVEK